MKALLSQLVYETLSAISYLSMQVAMRGGGLQGILSEVRGKLWHVWRDGLAFFSATYMIVFALPRWYVPHLPQLHTELMLFSSLGAELRFSGYNSAPRAIEELLAAHVSTL